MSYIFDNLIGEYPETFTLEFEDITYEVELNRGNGLLTRTLAQELQALEDHAEEFSFSGDWDAEKR